MAKIGSITYRSKAFMIKNDHQSIRLNIMQYFRQFPRTDGPIWIFLAKNHPRAKGKVLL